MPSPSLGWAHPMLVWYRVTSHLSDISQALTFPPTSSYPFWPLFGVGREASYLGVRPRPLSMAHDYLFMPLLPLLEGLGTFSWAWIPRASLLVVILHRAWEPEAASEVL